MDRHYLVFDLVVVVSVLSDPLDPLLLVVLVGQDPQHDLHQIVSFYERAREERGLNLPSTMSTSNPTSLCLAF